MRKTIGFTAALLAACIGGGTLWAQDKPCMADAARLCPGIEPGGGAQLTCLKEHKDELSPECKKNVMHAKMKHEEKKQMEEAPPKP